MSVEIKEVILPQIKEFNTMENQKIQEGLEIATLAGGCFGVEAVFLELEGSTCCYFWLYWGKQLILPIRKYVMEIQDMQKQLKSLSILLKSDRDLLESFATRSDYDKSSDDVGTQYRSEIFYHNESRKRQQGLHWFNDR
jgi:peptide-methionine (S)-S-oxide reductase